MADGSERRFSGLPRAGHDLVAFPRRLLARGCQSLLHLELLLLLGHQQRSLVDLLLLIGEVRLEKRPPSQLKNGLSHTHHV